jgi:ubiquinone/menaquinone biosynthesis C-methylase UbiE
MDYLESVDLERAEFGELYDELPLWSAPFGLQLLDAVPMRKDFVYLDVGAGTGFLTVELAQRCGPEATVIAVDPWPAATRRLRKKIEYLKLQNVQLLEQDLCSVDLQGESVDVIVSNLGIHNFEDVGAVLRRLWLLAKPGADLFLTTNLEGHMAEFYAVFRETLIELGQEDRLELLDAHTRSRGTVDSICSTLVAAGFHAQDVETNMTQMRFADGSAFLRHFFIRLGFLPAWIAVVDSDQIPASFDCLEQRLNAHAQVHGELSLSIPMACIRARKTVG